MISKQDRLTPLAITKILAADAENESMIVQINKIEFTRNGNIKCTISDGQNFTGALLYADQGITSDDEFTIISIKCHVVLTTLVGVVTFEVLTKQKGLLGSTISWMTLDEESQMKEEREFKFIRILKTETGLNKYELINELYVGQNRWTILCRITKKIWKVTHNGTKTLEIELVDKSKKKMVGYFFNDAAVEFNDYLKLGSIYEISRGRIIEENDNSKNENLSSIILMFDFKSQFNEVEDVDIIPKPEHFAITLGEVFNRKVFNQNYDVVAYVVAVEKEITAFRGQKSKTIIVVRLADPEEKILMFLRLENWREEFGDEMVGKVLIFSRFCLLKLNRSTMMCLRNSVKSCIIKNHGHIMKRYENRTIDVNSFITIDVNSFIMARREIVEQDTSNMVQNTKHLNHKIRKMNEQDKVKSILNVWINKIDLDKKWNYEACPKCKKPSKKYSKCAHCEELIEETELSFEMEVEISDFYGSIWVTVLDDLAKKIFYDMGNTAALQIKELSKDRIVLADALEKYLYQPFRMEVFTKKNHEGRIEHNVENLLEFNEEEIVRCNLGHLKELMGVRF